MAKEIAKTQESEEVAYLDTKVPSVHVVTKEQIAGGVGGSANLKKLHQVKELPVDITTHWTNKHQHWSVCVFKLKIIIHFSIFSHLIK